MASEAREEILLGVTKTRETAHQLEILFGVGADVSQHTVSPLKQRLSLTVVPRMEPSVNAKFED